MISVTDLTTFSFCPRKLYLSRVVKLPEPLKDVMILGGIKHKLLEEMPDLDKELANNLTEQVSFEDFAQEFVHQSTVALRMIVVRQKEALRSVSVPLDSAYRQTRALAIREAEWRARRLFDFAHENHLFGAELWERFTPKEKPEYSLSSASLALRGRIDALTVLSDRIIPIEHKSGIPPEEGVWESHKLQLSAYALLLEETFKVSVPFGVVNYFDFGVQREVPINPFAKDAVREMILVVNAVLSQKEVPPVVDNINKCKSCGYFSYCEKELKFIDGLPPAVVQV